MSDSHFSRKAALLLPLQTGVDDVLSRLILKLAAIDVEPIAPDALVSTLGTGGIQVIGASKWAAKAHDKLDPLVSVLNGILAGECFEDPLLTAHAFGHQRIHYIVAPLPKDDEECLCFGGFELGKFQTILAAITAGEVIPVVCVEDYNTFIECLGQNDPEKHAGMIYTLKAKAAAKLGGILGVLGSLNARAAKILTD